MNRILISFFALLIGLAAFNSVTAAFPLEDELVINTVHSGYVLDMAGLYTYEEADELNVLCSSMANENKANMYIVTIPSLENQDISVVASRLAFQWRPGKDKNDSGIVMLIAQKEHQAYIIPSKCMREHLPREQIEQIIGKMYPLFDSSDYYLGTKEVLSSVDDALEPYKIENDKRQREVGLVITSLSLLVIAAAVYAIISITRKYYHIPTGKKWEEEKVELLEKKDKPKK